MSEPEFKIGDRVQINPEYAEAYISPWDRRVSKGLFGNVVKVFDRHAPHYRYDIQLDMPKQAKYVHDWYWPNERPGHLKLVEAEAKP